MTGERPSHEGMTLGVTKQRDDYLIYFSAPKGGIARVVLRKGTFEKPGREVASRTLDKGDDMPTMNDAGTITFAGDEYVPNDMAEGQRWMAGLIEFSQPNVSSSKPARSLFTEDIGAAKRWQYATVNTGMFNSAERLTEVLGEAGRVGWELVTVYDKSSNWFGGMEKGFMLLRREVPEGVEPEAWSIQFSG